MTRTYTDGDDLGDDTFGEELDSYLRKGLEDGTAVMSGCTPSSGTGDSVDVAAGTVSVSGTLADVGGGNITLAARDDFDRLDLIVSSDTGALSAVTGASELRAPGLTSTQVLLAVVLVPQSSSGLPITVYDARPTFDRLYGDTVTAQSANIRDGRTGSAASLWADILNAQSALELPQLSSDPATSDLSAGEVWINTTDDALKHYNSGAGVVETIPTFDPANCQNPIVRVNLPTAGAVATEGVDPSNTAAGFDHLRYATSGNVLALHDQTASGRQAGMIDDFEDNDLSEYEQLGTGTATVQSAVTYEGSYAVELNYDGEASTIQSMSGLSRYPKAGDTFQARMRWEEDDDQTGVRFGVQDSSNFYLAIIEDDGIPGGSNEDGITLRKYEAGSGTVMSMDDSITFGTGDRGVWHRLVVEWGEGGQITVTLYDSSGTQRGQVSATDSTYTDGGIVWSGSQGTAGVARTSYVDAAEITKTTSGTGVIDDFEDNDMAEYTTPGTMTAVDINTARAYQGSYSIRSPDTSDSAAVSTSGLPRYPQEGDTFEAHGFIEDEAGSGQYAHRFAYADSNNWYDVYINPGRNPSIDVRVNNAGTVTSLATDNSTVPGDEWVKTVVEWGKGGDFTVTVKDSAGTTIATLTFTDTTHTGGGVYHYLSGGSNTGLRTYVDHWEITATSGDAAELGPVDDFEDQDMAEYTGDTANATIDGTGFVANGSYSVKLTESTIFPRVISTSGLDRYPQAGDAVDYRVEHTASGGNQFSAFLFGVQDASNRYDIALAGAAEELQFIVESGGTRTTLATAPVTISTGDQFRVHVEWRTSGEFEITAYDYSTGDALARISATDTTYTDGGIGLRSGGDGDTTTTFDQIELVEPTSTTGPVDDFEDNDISEYSGDTVTFAIDSSTVYEGSYSLRGDNDGSTFNEMESSSGLPRYPERGDTVRLRVQYTADQDPHFSIGDGNRSRYEFKMRDQLGDMVIFDRTDGAVIAQTSVTTGNYTNEWLEWEIVFGADGSMTYTAWDSAGSQIAQISATDSTNGGGWIGFQTGAASSGSSYFDIVEIV